MPAKNRSTERACADISAQKCFSLHILWGFSFHIHAKTQAASDTSCADLGREIFVVGHSEQLRSVFRHQSGNSGTHVGNP